MICKDDPIKLIIVTYPIGKVISFTHMVPDMTRAISVLSINRYLYKFPDFVTNLNKINYFPTYASEKFRFSGDLIPVVFPRQILPLSVYCNLLPA
jgi:hypothetical protein